MNHYTHGRQFLQQEQYPEAEAAFSAGRAEGDIRCIYGLMAVRAARGDDFSAESADLALVFAELEAMADRGDASAAFIIGRCYETGSATNADLEKALAYYARSADGGDADALFNLGCMYMQLGSCGRDTARVLYEQAAAQDHPRAIKALQHLTGQGSL